MLRLSHLNHMNIKIKMGWITKMVCEQTWRVNMSFDFGVGAMQRAVLPEQ